MHARGPKDGEQFENPLGSHRPSLGAASHSRARSGSSAERAVAAFYHPCGTAVGSNHESPSLNDAAKAKGYQPRFVCPTARAQALLLFPIIESPLDRRRPAHVGAAAARPERARKE